MAKPKKSKGAQSDLIHAKKSAIKEKIFNPFEVHLNKEKFSILGRKCKHDRGLPGVSRAKAIKRRKDTIGQEFQQLHKVNKFKDKRLGGEVPLDDDIANARFVTAKMMQFKTNKQDIFNLNDEEILTHRGQTLEEIEQFQNPASDDSEEEGLDAEFTEVAHFGGDKDGVDRKSAIEEKIAESKRKKIEIAKEKDEVYELTTKLDENYKLLIPLMGELEKNDGARPEKDAYDRVLKEMVFEPRGEVTDKLKSEDEIAEKNKRKLEKLEDERLARMRGEELGVDKPTHKSADDLDDGYFAGSGPEEEEEATLAYELNTHDEKANKIEATSSEDEMHETENDQMESEGDEESEEDDHLSDLRVSDSDPEENCKVECKKEIPESKSKQARKRHIKIEASTVLPFVFDIPTTYEELSALLRCQQPDIQHVIIERMIKCNHPRLEASNREKMVRLFGFLLQYLNDLFSDFNEANIESSFMVFDRMSPHLYDLTHMNPEKTSICFLEVLKEKYEDYKRNHKSFPSVEFIIFFKLASLLFSTSDFRHFIVTPSFIFISHILSRAQVKNRSDISIGLFLVTIALEYTQLSKRYLPAALNFLQGVIFLSIPKRSIEIIKVVPSFKSLSAQNNILVVSSDLNEDQKQTKMHSKDLVIHSIDDDFKVRALDTALRLLNDCIENIKDNVGACYFAESSLELLEKLDVANYPSFVNEGFQCLKSTLESIINQPLKRLAAKEKKPKALRLMEPRIERIYDDKRRPKMSKEKEMRAIMLHKVKRETKGAMREIRRDTAFISKLQIKQQIQSDLERKEKVRRIFSDAAAQQGELNAMARQRKK